MINILFETTDFLVINKPAGISVHGDGKATEDTVADWVLANYPETKDVGELFQITINKEQITIARPGIVHRLDKDTSGVMIIARTQAVYEFLKSQFHDRKVKKVYHAVTYGWPKEVEGEINLPIGRSRGDIRKWATGKATRGEMREAITLYKLLGTTPEYVAGKGSTSQTDAGYLELSPKTGRTHQIRVHLKSLNIPIVMDPLYAPEHPSLLGFGRLALHARSLEIALPDGTSQVFEAPFPSDFEQARQEINFLDTEVR